MTPNDYYSAEKVREVVARVRESIRTNPRVARLGVEVLGSANPVAYHNLGGQGLYIATLEYLCDALEQTTANEPERGNL